MKLIISGRNLKVSDRMKEQIEIKLERFEKLFNDEIEAHVTLAHQKTRQILEITIPLKNGGILRVEESSDDMFKSLDLAVDKLAKQIDKHKTNIKKRYQSNDSIRFDEAPAEVTQVENQKTIVKNKSFIMKPMDPGEAVLQMELVDHTFFVFLNSETNDINVVYTRRDGYYGLIEPE